MYHASPHHALGQPRHPTRGISRQHFGKSRHTSAGFDYFRQTWNLGLARRDRETGITPEWSRSRTRLCNTKSRTGQNFQIFVISSCVHDHDPGMLITPCILFKIWGKRFTKPIPLQVRNYSKHKDPYANMGNTWPIKRALPAIERESQFRIQQFINSYKKAWRIIVRGKR